MKRILIDYSESNTPASMSQEGDQDPNSDIFFWPS